MKSRNEQNLKKLMLLQIELAKIHLDTAEQEELQLTVADRLRRLTEEVKDAVRSECSE